MKNGLNIIKKLLAIYKNRLILPLKNTYLRTTLKYSPLLKPRKNLHQISIVREFHAPPYGGGNQFMLYLVKRLRKQGYDIRINSFSSDVKIFIADYCWFSKKYIDKMYSHKIKYNSKIIHRIDGLLTAYSHNERDPLDKIAINLNNSCYQHLIQEYIIL